TWIVGACPSLVIDPGPDDPSHVAAVARQASHVQAILLTHHHPDHAPGAPRLSDLTGAPILALRPEPGEVRLRDGQIVEAGVVRAVRVGPRSAERFAAAVPRACLRCGRPAPAGSALCDRCRLSLLQETPGSSA